MEARRDGRLPLREEIEPRRRRAPVRASDADRDRAVRALRDHYAAGRLTTEELDERVERACQATFRSELWPLLADLPRERRARFVRQLARAHRATLPAHAGGYVGTNALLVAIWQLTGGGEFWPAWVLAPTTVMLGWHATATYLLARATGRSQGRRALPRGDGGR